MLLDITPGHRRAALPGVADGDFCVFERHVGDARTAAHALHVSHRDVIEITAGRRVAYQDALIALGEAYLRMKVACGISWEKPASTGASDAAVGEAPLLPATPPGLAPPVAPEGYAWALIPLSQRPATCAASADAGAAPP